MAGLVEALPPAPDIFMVKVQFRTAWSDQWRPAGPADTTCCLASRDYDQHLGSCDARPIALHERPRWDHRSDPPSMPGAAAVAASIPARITRS